MASAAAHKEVPIFCFSDAHGTWATLDLSGQGEGDGGQGGLDNAGRGPDGGAAAAAAALAASGSGIFFESAAGMLAWRLSDSALELVELVPGRVLSGNCLRVLLPCKFGVLTHVKRPLTRDFVLIDDRPAGTLCHTARYAIRQQSIVLSGRACRILPSFLPSSLYTHSANPLAR